jgi:DNA-binding Lrp family transcriptional regulator
MDAFDKKLLSQLQNDSRLTNQQLAERIGLSASQCSRRRTHLEQTGIITGYRALIDREKTGFSLTVLVDVMLNTHSQENAKRFANLVNTIPQVEEAYTLTGAMDYQLKLCVRDLDELTRVINDNLLPDESVQTVKSAIVLQTLKASSGLPLELL